MRDPSLRFLAVALSLLMPLAPAAGQVFGPQQNQIPPSQPGGYGAGPMPPMSGQSLIGTWSGQTSTPNGTVAEARGFGTDGTFATVNRLPNGFFGRVWGTYRLEQVGASQFNLEIQRLGWMPRETCTRFQGGPMQCQPVSLASSATLTVTFIAPDQIQIEDRAEGNGVSLESRTVNPPLLQVQAPERWVTNMVPSQNPMMPAPGYAPRPMPSYGGGAPRYGGAPACNDLQQRRIGSINNGHLVTSGGCLTCIQD